MASHDWQLAIDAHPEIVVDANAFAGHVDACRERGARAENAGDLLIAWATGRGDAAAMRELDRMIVREADLAARRVDRSSAFADEVRQALRVRLLVAESGPARIEGYIGRGPLGGWIAVAALRVALNLKRGTRAAASPDILAELVSCEADPELRHLKSLYRAEFREALEAALLAQPDRQRALLRLSFVDGLRMNQLAQLYDVHETTAARWVSRAAADVAEDTRRRLMTRLALSPSSLDSVARMVLSNLDVSIARVLGR
jgi:RNA polymerase sigma-70 factor (ECF subfamily)